MLEYAGLRDQRSSSFKLTTLLYIRILSQSNTWHMTVALYISSEGVSCPGGGIPLICMSISKNASCDKGCSRV